MGLYFDLGDRFAISQLVLESNDEIVFKTDRDGFVFEASPAIRQLGFPMVEMLIGPHICDLVDEKFRPVVEDAFRAALTGDGFTNWIEFRSSSVRVDGRWFAIRFSITASVGLTCVAGDLDQTVRAAEAALRLARAKGGNTVAASI